MANGVQVVPDIFGAGRLAQQIRANREEAERRKLLEQQSVTTGLQQQLLRGQVQKQQGALSDLEMQRQQQKGLMSALYQDTGESQTLKRINFLKNVNPQAASQLFSSTLEQAEKISKFNPQAGVDFVNSELGLNFKLEGQTKDTYTINQGDKVSIIDKATGNTIRELPVSPKPTDKKDTETTLIKNLEAAGLVQGTPAFQQAVLSNLQKTGKTQTIKVNPDGSFEIAETVGLPEKKFMAKQKEAEKADMKRTENAIGQANTVINKVDQVLENVGLGTAGAGSLFSIIPGTPAKDLSANIETLKANLAFNALQAMREASKTGGALGAVSERELSLLESQIASLNPQQSPEQLRTNLNEVRQSFKNMLDKAKTPIKDEPNENIKVLNFDAQGNLIQ